MIDLAPLFGAHDAPGQQVSFRVFPRRGPERWLLETRYRRPWHLETWPQANLRAKVIYRGAWVLGSLGLQLPWRLERIHVAEGSPYEHLQARFDALGVFLGTPGANRKVVVFAKDGDRNWFLKVPISVQAKALARTEAAALDHLAEHDGWRGTLPKYFWIGDILAIEDVRHDGSVFAPLDDREVLRIHSLLFDSSHEDVPLDTLLGRWTHLPDTSSPHTHRETAARIATARAAARSFLRHLEPAAAIECYMAHGDFTRWNVLRAKDGSARIIDWELFAQRPKFFDPFHYVASQAILVDRMSAKEILNRAKAIAAESLDYQSIGLYFGLYIASQVFYYSAIYERQSELNPQLYWQLDTWTELLTLTTRTFFEDDNAADAGGKQGFDLAR